MPKSKTQEWAEKCAKSNGSMFLLPDHLTEESSALDELTEKANKIMADFNKLNAELDVRGKNFFYEIRKFMETQGTQGAYDKNLGFNAEAKKDGVKVINVVAQTPQGMQM